MLCKELVPCQSVGGISQSFSEMPHGPAAAAARLNLAASRLNWDSPTFISGKGGASSQKFGKRVHFLCSNFPFIIKKLASSLERILPETEDCLRGLSV